MNRLCAWLLLWTAFFSATYNGWSQPGCTPFLASHIHTFRMTVDGDAERYPVIALNGNERLDISFDDMTHEYRRYTYRLEHVGYDGKSSDELFESDYLYSTADEGIIEDYAPSQNTSVQYTHYSFCIPNAQMKPKLSGNYKLTISTEDDNDETVPVAVAYFGVVDTQVGLLPTCSTNTEVDWNVAHQQVSLRMDCSRLTLRDAAFAAPAAGLTSGITLVASLPGAERHDADLGTRPPTDFQSGKRIPQDGNSLYPLPRDAR